MGTRDAVNGTTNRLFSKVFILACASFIGAAFALFIYLLWIGGGVASAWASIVASVLGSALSAILAYAIATYTVERSIAPVWRQVELQNFESGLRVQKFFFDELRAAEELQAEISAAANVGQAILERANYPYNMAKQDLGRPSRGILSEDEFRGAIDKLSATMKRIDNTFIQSIPDTRVDLARNIYWSACFDLQAALENAIQHYGKISEYSADALHRYRELDKWLSETSKAERKYIHEIEDFIEDTRAEISRMAPFSREA